MSYAVEFTPGAEDDLMRLYDDPLERAQTLEDLDVASVSVKVIRQAALSHLAVQRAYTRAHDLELREELWTIPASHEVHPDSHAFQRWDAFILHGGQERRDLLASAF